MDSITEMIKREIRAQYKTVSKFSEVSGIPYSTLSNALSRGVSGTSYATVVKICELLQIKQASDNGLVLYNSEFQDFYSKLTRLDEQGVHTVCAVLNVEYQRCVGTGDDGVVKAFNGIGYASSSEQPFDSKVIHDLVKKAQRNER